MCSEHIPEIFFVENGMVLGKVLEPRLFLFEGEVSAVDDVVHQLDEAFLCALGLPLLVLGRARASAVGC